MSKRKALILLLMVTLLVAIWARESIWRFFFHPDGISTAAGELCVSNESDRDLVVEIDVEGGARSISLLSPGEVGCAQSATYDASGQIRVSEEDSMPPFCEREGQVGETIKLNKFSPETNCDWNS